MKKILSIIIVVLIAIYAIFYFLGKNITKKIDTQIRQNLQEHNAKAGDIECQYNISLSLKCEIDDLEIKEKDIQISKIIVKNANQLRNFFDKTKAANLNLDIEVIDIKNKYGYEDLIKEIRNTYQNIDNIDFSNPENDKKILDSFSPVNANIELDFKKNKDQIIENGSIDIELVSGKSLKIELDIKGIEYNSLKDEINTLYETANKLKFKSIDLDFDLKRIQELKPVKRNSNLNINEIANSFGLNKDFKKALQKIQDKYNKTGDLKFKLSFINKDNEILDYIMLNFFTAFLSGQLNFNQEPLNKYKIKLEE